MKKLSFENFFAPLAIVFLVLLFFLPNLLLGKIPIPADSLIGLYHPWRDQSFGGFNTGKFPVKNSLITDPILQTYPWRYLVIENFKKGDLPLWNPYSFAGQPLLANIQSSSFQFTNILFFLMPFKISWAIQVILPTVFSAIFMYLFLTDLGILRSASALASIVLPFSGFFVAWMTWGSIVAGVMWLPLILLCLNRLLRGIYIIWFLILTFAVSQVILSGHWQAGFYVMIAVVVYLLFQIKGTFNIKSLNLIFWAFFLAILIGALQIIPSLEFINLSARGMDQGYFSGRKDWFLPIENLIQIIAPDFFGNPTKGNYWGIWNYAEFVGFVGVVPLVLALVAFFKKSKITFFFLILAVISLGLAIENPISKIPYVLGVPLLSSVQPSRAIFLFDFAFVGLCAVGFDYFLKNKKLKLTIGISSVVFLVILILAISTFIFPQFFPKIENINISLIALRNLVFPAVTSLGLILILAVFYFKPKKELLIAAIFILTIGEFFRFGYRFIPFSKFSYIFPDTETTKFLQGQGKPFRIIATDRRIFHPNTFAFYKIESTDGYDPLYLANYAQLVSVWQSNNPSEKSHSFNRIVTPQKIDSKITNLLNVKYILTFDNIENPSFSKIFEKGETKIYKNNKALARAFFVKEVKRVSSSQDELSLMLDSNFDLSTSAVSQEFDFRGDNDAGGYVNFRDYNDQSFTLITETTGDIPLVITNISYPGWQALIDEKETAIYKTNFTFQSIMVPRGKHVVEFKFRPKSFYNGMYISASGIVLTLLSAIFLWRRKYQ